MATVLVVDDSPTELHVLQTTLEKSGYKVEVSSSGEDGLEKARQLKPDLIIMDVVMPGINGFQATRQLHRDQETTEIPIIIVTTKAQESDKVWGMRQGASEYLVKPVQAKELIGAVRAVLAK